MRRERGRRRERQRERGGRRKERKEKLRVKMDDLCFVSVPHNGNKISFYDRCGLLLDIWMLPLGDEVCEAGIEKPLVFINSKVFTLWKKNFSSLTKLLKHSQTLAAGLGTESNIGKRK